MLAAFALPGEFARLIDAGNALYGKAEFKRAADKYGKALDLQPESAEGTFNLGAARYKLNDHGNALSDFSKAARTAEGQLKEHAEYNAGNCAYRMQKFDDAIDRYKRALTLDPSDMWAKHNLEMALRAKEQQDRDQEKKEDKKQDKDQDKRQDEQQDKQQDERQDEQQDEQQAKQQDRQQDKDEEEQAKAQDTGEEQPLTPEQAARLLSALAREDANMQKIIRRAPEPPSRAVDKDW